MRSINFCFPSIVALFTFSSIIWFGGELNLSQCIETLAYINIVRFPLLLIPIAASNLFQARVSLARINKFLSLPESPNVLLEDKKAASETLDDKHNEIVYRLNNASFSFLELVTPDNDAEQVEHTIRGLTFTIRSGSFVGIVGEVGAGKTCLVKGLLGELRPPTNTFTKSSNIRTAYCDQTPVIFNSTVRAKVLFGLPMEEPLYFECIDSSCLQEDIDSFVDNDLTEIGEHGVNLSGGQRADSPLLGVYIMQSINILMKNFRRVAIFDDPLSAVDVDVAHKMFTKGLLNQGKGLTRILVVSSHMHLLEKADMIISMSKNGQMKDSALLRRFFVGSRKQ